MVHGIAERCSPERIILFGSHALGQACGKLCAGWKPALRRVFNPPQDVIRPTVEGPLAELWEPIQ